MDISTEWQCRPRLGVPAEFQPVVRRLLAEVESVGWERRGFKQEAVLDELKKRFYASLAGERR